MLPSCWAIVISGECSKFGSVWYPIPELVPLVGFIWMQFLPSSPGPGEIKDVQKKMDKMDKIDAGWKQSHS